MFVKSLQGRRTPVHAMNAAAEQHQTAADPWTKPTDLSHWPTFRRPWNYIHHRHFLLLSPEADTHYTVPQRVEGWVNLDGWLYTQTVYLLTRKHLEKVHTTRIVYSHVF